MQVPSLNSGAGIPMNITVSENTLSSADGDESGKDVRMTGGVVITGEDYPAALKIEYHVES